MTNSHPATIDTAAVREIVIQHLGVRVDAAALNDETNLYTIGLTSLATVGLMLALEDHFNVEFPETLLSRNTFRSVGTIAEAVASLVE